MEILNLKPNYITFDMQTLFQKLQQISNLTPYHQILKQRLQRFQNILKGQDQFDKVFDAVESFKLSLSYKASQYPNTQKEQNKATSQIKPIDNLKLKSQRQRQKEQQQRQRQLQQKKQQTEISNIQQQSNKNKKPQQLNQKVKEKPKSFPNIFIYQYILSTTIQEYQKITRSPELQKKLDQNLDTYQILKQFSSNDLQLVHLTYKRVLLIAPREFVYLRWFIRKSNKLWIVTMSVPYQLKSTKMRADILLSVSQIQQKQKQIIVKVFSEVDMKAIVKADMAKSKGSFQIKKFIQRTSKYLQKKNF